MPQPSVRATLLDGLGERAGYLRAGVGRSPLGIAAGTIGLLGILVAITVVVLYAAGASNVVAPHPEHPVLVFPAWEAGPLRSILGRLPLPRHQGQIALSLLMAALIGAYLMVIAAARSLRGWQVTGFIALSAAILFLAPPMRLNDVFNYLGYARLGGLHGLNPYTHVIASERGDPVFAFTSWRNLSSPYGELFTALTYPLAKLSLPVAYWVLKAVIILSGLGFLWCLARCAKLLGKDWRPVVLFVAASPVYFLYEVGGFHNDVLMLLFSTAAIMFLLDRRDRSAGAMLTLAVAIKFTAIVLLPFLLLAARPVKRRLRVLTGLVAAGIPIALMSLALFGLSLPNVSGQSRLVTGYSIPNLLGLVLGLGGSTAGLVRILDLTTVAVVLWGLRRGNWVAAAGWSTLALTLALAWLMPWYIVWTLPLAALSSSTALRGVAVGMSIFVLLTFAPAAGTVMANAGINPMGTPVGRAAIVYQRSLQWVSRPVRHRRRHAHRPERGRDRFIAVRSDTIA